MENSEKYWEQRAQYIYLSHYNSRAGRYLLDSIIKRIVVLGKVSRNSKILEIGCAAGTQLNRLKQEGFNGVFGLDINLNVLKMAKNNSSQQKLNGTFLIQGDCLTLPLKSESFDLVFSVAVMEHIRDLEGCLFEQKRVLKKEGILIMAVPNKYCPWWHTIKKWRAKISKKRHFAFPSLFRTFSPSEGVLQLKDAGFSNIRWEAADSIFPQCPDNLAALNIFLEKIIAKTPILKHTQPMLYFSATH